MTRRLVLGYLGVTIFVLLALELPLGIQNQRSERRDVEAKVERDGTTVASLAEDAIRTGKTSQLKPIAALVYAYARRSGTRVVVVDSRGYARIDTSRRTTGPELFATAARPEVRSALLGRVASGTRYSHTLGTRLLYVAVPIASGRTVHGAVRITYPLSSVEARIVRYWLILAAIAAIVVAAAVLVGLAAARFVTRPLRRLEHAAAAVGGGDLEARALENEGPPEVRSLATVFNETVSRLRQLLRSQEEFVADASHELRTPLTGLRLRLENLEQAIAHESRGDLEAALREAERLSRLVESLLALARADAGTAPAGSVDLAALARERLELWRPLAEERGIVLVANTNGAVAARSAPIRLAQVLDNLLSNALDASPQGTTISVSARARGDHVELRVRDQGPGMTPQQRARAFDRFWRSGSGEGGSGLGLAIVRRLVEVDEGEVELGDAPGGGLDAVVRLRRG